MTRTDCGCSVCVEALRAELAVARAEAQFWKEQTLRSMCGCLTFDCDLHGKCIPDEYDRARVAFEQHAKGK
jgi:hypothetical protein